MTLVTNGRLITRDPEGQGYYEHGAVAYEGTKIVEIGEEAALRAKYPQAEIIDAKGGVIMPPSSTPTPTSTPLWHGAFPSWATTPPTSMRCWTERGGPSTAI